MPGHFLVLDLFQARFHRRTRPIHHLLVDGATKLPGPNSFTLVDNFPSRVFLFLGQAGDGEPVGEGVEVLGEDLSDVRVPPSRAMLVQ